MPKPHVTLYIMQGSDPCRQAKEWLDTHKISYKEIDVTNNEKAAEEMVEKTGQWSVPVILVDQDGDPKTPATVVGFEPNTLEKLLAEQD